MTPLSDTERAVIRAVAGGVHNYRGLAEALGLSVQPAWLQAQHLIARGLLRAEPRKPNTLRLAPGVVVVGGDVWQKQVKT